ncbi:hypothetical protein CASFOL_009523 [Castilleja foliolosa]|uniref:Uncharacterized protein n=1 Tax=Castilleja foliolosa TaxID=1961234 RepID=A0ABD3E0F6_9LAMI
MSFFRFVSIPTLLSGSESALELLPDFISNRAAVLLSLQTNLARELDFYYRRGI